jgi:transcriptional regulator with XRE-family HTH domain
MPQDNFFKKRRDELGKTQFEIATELGIHPANVSSWESGTVPRIAMAEELARVYRVSVDRILSEMHGLAVAKA